MMLPNHNRTTQVFPDTMHTVKDCIEKLFFLITGKTNLEPIIKCETSMGRLSLNHKRKHTSTSKKAVELPYVLNAEEIKLADKRSKSIIMPNSDFNLGCTFYRTTGLKSHDWKEVAICIDLELLTLLNLLILLTAYHQKYSEILLTWNATRMSENNLIWIFKCTAENIYNTD